LGKKELFKSLFSAYVDFFQSMYKFRWFIFESTRLEIKIRYRGSLLGILWSFINPSLQAVIIFFVFREVLGVQDIENVDFFVYIYSGVLVLNFFLTTLLSGGELIFSKNHLMRNTQISLHTFLAITIASNTINLIVGSIPLSIYMSIKENLFSARLIYLPFLLGIMFIWLLAGGALLNMIYSRFLDLRQLMPIILGLLVYLTPIYYSMQSLSGQFLKTVVGFNPLTIILSGFRFSLGITDNISTLALIIIWFIGMALWPIASRISRDYREKVWAVQ